MSISGNIRALMRAAVELDITRHPDEDVHRAQYQPPNPGDPDSIVPARGSDGRHEGI